MSPEVFGLQKSFGFDKFSDLIWNATLYCTSNGSDTTGQNLRY